jgi:quercetin dioxygenase-like cupin family protein
MRFVPLPIEHGLLLEADGVRVHGWSGAALELGDGTTFGLVTETTRVALGQDVFVLRAGAYFVAPEPVRIAQGRGLAVLSVGYRGLRQLGGPIEPSGRLRYIDGCTDTLLVCPPRRGEACLNHLHIPAGTNQTAHTHPSMRVGVIARGSGLCRAADGEHALGRGLAWYIPAGLCHSFITHDAPLDVLAWHPDSDFGPTDQDHPMRNRTML